MFPITAETEFISIHALRVEGDILLHYYTREIAYISIHALRVEGDAVIAYQMCNYVISIHALRVEGDRSLQALHVLSSRFLSTPSGWRATEDAPAEEREAYISIHALRVEGDSKNGQSFRLFLRKREKNLPL